LKCYREARSAVVLYLSLLGVIPANAQTEVALMSPSTTPSPTISSLNPASVTAGGPAFTLDVIGSGFLFGAVVQWNGASLSTSFELVTSAFLSAVVPASLIATQGNATITVLNSDRTLSNAVTFTINPPAAGGGGLVITSVSPNSAVVGGPALSLVVSGTGFVAASTVQWNGSVLSTTFVNAAQLIAAVPASLIAAVGAAGIKVANPGGTTSNAFTFTIASPVPNIASASPNSAVAGGLGFTLTVSGTGFVAASTVQWNNSVLSTAFVNGTQLTAAVPANLIATAGSAAIRVVNPGGTASNAITFTIAPPALSIITGPLLPPATVGLSYSQAMAATGGVTPYKTWTVSGGTLPPGLSLTTIGGFLSGLLNGVPTTPGTFSFTVQVNDNANTTAAKQFSLTVNPGAISLPSNGVVNAAGFTGGPVAPGEIITIFGSGLGPNTLTSLQIDNKGYVSTSLAGTQVTFDGVPAPLIYVQSAQVSAVVPYAVSGGTSTRMQVSVQGQSSNLVTLPVGIVAPGIFTIDSSGHGQGAILNQDGTTNSPGNPAAAGSFVFVYATGEGETSPAGIDGKPGDSPPPRPLQLVTATVGGIGSQVQYAGGISGLVAGVLQVNVQIPQGVNPGNSVPIVLIIGGTPTQANVTLAVRQ
jgi:uncharacterized protein (TIGR03437 family)